MRGVPDVDYLDPRRLIGVDPADKPAAGTVPLPSVSQRATGSVSYVEPADPQRVCTMPPTGIP